MARLFLTVRCRRGGRERGGDKRPRGGSRAWKTTPPGNLGQRVARRRRRRRVALLTVDITGNERHTLARSEKKRSQKFGEKKKGKGKVKLGPESPCRGP